MTETPRVTRRGLAIAGISAFLGGVVGAAIGRVALPPVEKTVTELRTVTSPVVTTQTQLQTVTVTSPVVTTQVQTVTLEKPIIVGGGAALPERPFPVPSNFRYDWKYVAERAFSGYKAVCCCFGAGDALIGTLIDSLDISPWNSLPGKGAYDPTKPLGAERYVALYDAQKKEFYGFTGVFQYGCGGYNGWGLMCGILLGVATALQLFLDRSTAGKIIDEVTWAFENEPMPDPEVASYISSIKGYKENVDYVIVDEAANTTMCHSVVAEITSRAIKAGITDSTKLGTVRSNTCGLLTATFAVKAARLVNEYLDKGSVTTKYSQPQEAKTCLTCHSLTGISQYRIHINMKDYCSVCHKQGWSHP